MVSDVVLSQYLDFAMLREVILPVVLVFAVLILFLTIFRTPGSSRYRSMITDLYVVGMIRKFATEDGIDLEKEMKELKRLEKLRRMSHKDLDEVVEEELKEKISAKNEKSIEQLESKK